MTLRPAVHQLVVQFADTLKRLRLRVPEFIEQATTGRIGKAL
jgi:hypothetical protein